MHRKFQNLVDCLSSASNSDVLHDGTSQAAAGLDLSRFAYLSPCQIKLGACSFPARSNGALLRAKQSKIVHWRIKSCDGGESGSQTHDFQSFHFEEERKLLSKRSPASSINFKSEPGSIPVGDCGDRNGMGPACCRALVDLFLRVTAVRHLVGIPVGIRSNRRLKLSQIQIVIRLDDCRPGAPSFAAIAASALAGQPRPLSIIASAAGRP